jgi:phosphoesterase RecJ-like protein
MINFTKLQDIIESHNSFLLTCHVNPDADAIGSEIALYEVLKQLGKKVFIINHSLTPYNLLFLDKENIIEQFNLEKHEHLFHEVDVLVALDFNKAERMVRLSNSFRASTKLKICIDHHQDPEEFVDHLFVDVGYTSTGEIIYDLIKKTNLVTLNYEMAYPIYAAIMTDTGSFRFERTTSDTHRIAAELLDLKVDPGEVFDKIYDQSHFGKIKLLGKALASLTLYGSENKIGYMTLTHEMINESKALESDTDGFVNFSLSVDSVVLGMLFIELKEGFKVSFRSKGNIPVNKLAGEFGGGGHLNASGARFFNQKLSDHQQKILSKAEEYLDK